MSGIDAERIHQLLLHAQSKFIKEQLRKEEELVEAFLAWSLKPDVGKVERWIHYFNELAQLSTPLQLEALASSAKEYENALLVLKENGELGPLTSTLLKGLALIRQQLDHYDALLRSATPQLQSYALLEPIIDDLTGVYTSQYFHTRFAEERERYRRGGFPFSLAMVQLTHFDQLLEQYGTFYGEYLLQQVAQQIRAQLREIDQIYYCGGDQFLILLPMTDVENAFKAMERTRKRISYIRFQLPNYEEEATVTFHAGLVMIQFPEQEQDELLQWSKNALKRAQEMESCCYIYYPDVSQLERQKRKRILVVDDVDMFSEMICTSLRALDYEVEVAKDGDEAFWKCISFRPQLLILDLVLPQMDGFQLLEKLRTMPEMRKLMVIIISSRTDEEDISQAFKLGVRDYLMKPFTTELLEERVKRLL